MGQWKENTCEDALHIVRGRTDTRRGHKEKKEGFAEFIECLHPLATARGSASVALQT